MKKLILSLFAFLMTFTMFGQGKYSNTLLSASEIVLAAVNGNPNAIVITGKLLDANTSQPITNAKLNFSKMGQELFNAAVDANGNYAVALNKDEFGKNASLMMKIAGYEDFKMKKLKKSSAVQHIDLRLVPDDINQPTLVKYQLSDDPYNTLVIKF